MNAAESVEDKFATDEPPFEEQRPSRWSGFALFAVVAALLLAEPIMLFLLIYRDRFQ